MRSQTFDFSLSAFTSSLFALYSTVASENSVISEHSSTLCLTHVLARLWLAHIELLTSTPSTPQPVRIVGHMSKVDLWLRTWADLANIGGAKDDIPFLTI
jgi:hypothetical protein